MKNKKNLFGLIALVGVLAISATIAYFSETLNMKNELSTTRYGSEIIEKFTPRDDWEPGAEVEKTVGVSNTGDSAIVARAKWEETWVKKDGSTTTVSSKNAMDGTESMVIKNINNTPNDDDKGYWLEYNEDGYYYYTSLIEPNFSSEHFLQSITLKENVDMIGNAITKNYYTKCEAEPTTIGTDPETSWVEYTGSIPTGATYNKSVVTGNGEYADANYTLTITVEVYQATKKALVSTNFESATPTLWNLIED